MMGSWCAWVVSLIPTAPPACADEAANQIYPNARSRSEFGRSCSCAAVVTSAESGPHNRFGIDSLNAVSGLREVAHTTTAVRVAGEKGTKRHFMHTPPA